MLRNDDVTSSRSLRSLPLNRAGGSEDGAGVRRREGEVGTTRNWNISIRLFIKPREINPVRREEVHINPAHTPLIGIG